eukprot:Blabericola_migrator_1__938@NODE_1234_length_5022_cov_165_311604_g832_i1_p1_GENE_NODE_1234_length_5022_cov_165_311604_g832_i1NODE_1234_length_5022_cov_165_311604_g832_i1_p1_ORF_typecomplete_len707_score120_59RRM_5/PF13893_6/1_5e09RRM_5/PF13893_6/4_7e13RRM_5/PF13893_6/1_1e21RRM_5/PF13893_6/4_5e11RRM_8/PF11835_8/42RRM_8/PF11835_8/1_6e23RRM_8/PF11835_8/0_019RRM_8/PF11835_8/0_7RRM_1/PF00076_22/0_0024RRM_1/PF00076_22/0_00015RRM_1/PF00076_22/0_023RRM_1/PF00076_22/4_3e11RRM_occluded/PF16842_5/1_1RRM_oc
MSSTTSSNYSRNNHQRTAIPSTTVATLSSEGVEHFADPLIKQGVGSPPVSSRSPPSQDPPPPVLVSSSSDNQDSVPASSETQLGPSESKQSEGEEEEEESEEAARENPVQPNQELQTQQASDSALIKVEEPPLVAATPLFSEVATSSSDHQTPQPPLDDSSPTTTNKRRMLNDGTGFAVPQSVWRPENESEQFQSESNTQYDTDKYEGGYQTSSSESDRRGGKVLLLRNLIPSVLESDVEAFVSPFTRTTRPKIYLQFAAGQAFVEFGTLQDAQHAYQYFKAHPTSLKGQVVQVHFSDRQCVTAPDDKNTDFRVLLATVTNLMYPVDIELLRFLFSRFGTVQKIISFSKATSTFQALIQMADAQMARDALQALHSRNIYDGCNTLQIQPSRLPELTVRINNHRAWDYTVAPEGVPPRCSSADTGGLITSQPRLTTPSSPVESAQVGQDENQAPGASLPGHIRATQSPAFAKVFQMPRLPKEVREWKAMVMSNATPPTNVLIVYNLTPNVVTVTELFNVFSLYGILQRVKILRDKPHTALLQYSDPLYASLAAHFLQQAAFFDQKQGIQIGFSRNAEVKLSHAVGPENLKRTRAFQPQEQRYNPNEVEKFIRAACSPTCTLFIANLREDVDESTIRTLVQQYGTVTKVQLKAPSDGSRRRFAMVEMSNKHEALCALAHLHNTYVEQNMIKVAFSKGGVENCKNQTSV